VLLALLTIGALSPPSGAAAADAVAPRWSGPLRVTPENSTVVLGASRAFIASRQEYGGGWHDVTAETIFYFQDGNGLCTKNVCTPTAVGVQEILARHEPLDGSTATKDGITLTAVRLDQTMKLVINPGRQSVEAGSAGTPYQTRVQSESGQSPATQESVDTRPPIVGSRLPGVQDFGEVTDRTGFAVDGFPCLRNSCTSIETGRHTVTATFTDVESDTTISAKATLDVRAGPAVHLVLDPAQSSIHAGESQHYAALGYDQYGNPVPSKALRPRLTIDDPDGSCPGTTCTSSKLGSHTVTGTATVRDAKAGTRRISATATLRVGVGPPARIDLLPATYTIAAGAKRTYQAMAYDTRGNKLGDLADVAIFAISPDGSCERNVCTATRPGEHTITATLPIDPVSVSATAILRVEPGDPASLYLGPSTWTITSGSSILYRVGGYDAGGNDLGDLAGRATLTIKPEGSCAGTSCTATKPGEHVVTATLVGSDLSTQANLRVESGPVAALDLRPRSSTIGAGGSRSYTVEGIDSYGLPLGDVTAKATLTITPEGTCTRTSCTATLPGRYVVTASIPGTAITAEASLYVEPGRVARLALDPAGSSIGAGGSQTYSVRGFDADQNQLGDLTSRASFSIAPDGSCVHATCTADRTGDHTVTATVLGRTAVEDTSTSVTLHVGPGMVAALTLDPVSTTVAVGSSQTYSVRGFDAQQNELGDLTSRASFSIAPDGSCVQATCTAAEPGAHTVTATLSRSDGSGELSRRARLEVLAARPARLRLDPPTASRGVGAGQPYTVRAVDTAGNDLGDVTARATFAITPDGVCTGNVCTAENAGSRTVTARLASGGIDGEISGTATMTVTPATPARLVLDPPRSSIAPGKMQDYRMHGYDARGNDLGDFTARTRFTIRPDGWCTRSQCTSRTTGDHTVTGAVILPNAARGAGISTQPVSEAILHIRQGAGSSLLRLLLNALTWTLAAGAVLLAAARWIRRRVGPRPAPDGQPQPEAQLRSEIGPSTLMVRTEPSRGSKPTRSVRVQIRHRERTVRTRDEKRQ